MSEKRGLAFLAKQGICESLVSKLRLKTIYGKVCRQFKEKTRIYSIYIYIDTHTMYYSLVYRLPALITHQHAHYCFRRQNISPLT